MALPRRNNSLADDLGLLASALEMLDLEEDEATVAGLADTRDRLARSIRSYLIPRLTDPHGPLTVVFAGPTGSGKSTLVNSVSGLDVSSTGPIRPTTTGPVVLTTPAHLDRFSRISGVECEVVTGEAPILSRLALIDTPDIDSMSTQNRVVAEILIDNADIVVFVTSALRYADLVPWEVLRRAASRGAPLVNVLNRVTPGSAGAVADFRSKLDVESLNSEIVRVPEHHVRPGTHRLPSLAVRELQRRLLGLEGEIAENRREAFNRVLDSTTAQVFELSGNLSQTLVNADRHRQHLRSAFEAAARELDIASLCVGLVPDYPEAGRLRRTMWKNRNRFGAARWADFRRRLGRRLVALVENDVRAVVLGHADTSRTAEAALQNLRVSAALAAEAWIDQLETMAGGGSRRLAAAILADASARGHETPAFGALFQDASTIARAYRALISRLELVYSEIGNRVAAVAGAPPIDPGDAERLREAVSMVVARSQFADA